MKRFSVCWWGLLFPILALALVCFVPNSEHGVHPPGWIVGSWFDRTGTILWTFSSDDAIQEIGTLVIDYVKLDSDYSGEEGSGVYDWSSSDIYQIILKRSGEPLQTLQFEKKQAGIVEYTVLSEDGNRGPIQLLNILRPMQQLVRAEAGS